MKKVDLWTRRDHRKHCHRNLGTPNPLAVSFLHAYHGSMGLWNRAGSWRIVLAWTLLVPVAAAGQSLGEAARKEQERRERAKKAGASAPTLTEKDLAESRGTTLNVTGQRIAKPEAPPASASRKTPRAPDTSTESSESYWRGRAIAAHNRVSSAEARYGSMDAAIRLGQAGVPDANGVVRIYSQQQLKTMADRAQAELAAAKQALEEVLEEGRRAGALPGWLRE